MDHTHPNGHFGGNDNFVARSRGYFVPSVTANHLFYMKADDEIKFSFNKNGRDPAGAVNDEKFFIFYKTCFFALW